MDKPKTPEESKFSEDDFKYHTDTIVRIMKNAICKKGSTPNDAIDELNSFFAYAISAERNANAEKIVKQQERILELEKDAEFRIDENYKLFCMIETLTSKLRISEDVHKTILKQDEGRIKSLESKLAETEKELKICSENRQSRWDKITKLEADNQELKHAWGKRGQRIDALEAEAKALKEYNLLIQINSLDLEEIEKAIAGDFEYSNEYENLTSFFREVFDKKKSAIRALNSGKE